MSEDNFWLFILSCVHPGIELKIVDLDKDSFRKGKERAAGEGGSPLSIRTTKKVPTHLGTDDKEQPLKGIRDFSYIPPPQLPSSPLRVLFRELPERVSLWYGGSGYPEGQTLLCDKAGC